MTEPDEARGTTRRALLRNSALGLGAVVGGAALVTTGATAADAATAFDHLYLALDGVTGASSAHGLSGAIVLRSVSWSLTEDVDPLSNEVLSPVHPSLVVLTMPASKASPALLKHLVGGQVSATGTIRLYHPNALGEQTEYDRITLTQVRVVGFHQTMSEGDAHNVHGSLVDTVKLTYASLEFEYVDTGIEATYTVPPPVP